MGRPEEEKAPSPAPVSEQLHHVEEAGLLLHLIEDDEARAVIEPSHVIGRQAQAFLGIAKGERT